MKREPDGPPDTPEARAIETYKAAGLFEVHPDDVDKPWGEQRLVKTPLGVEVENKMRERHPEWFRGDA